MFKLLEFNELGDQRGHLVVVEGIKDIPFEIKRVFYIYGTNQNTIRGLHANRESEFVLINVSGACKVKIRDGKGNEEIVELSKPHQGLYIPKMIWKEMYDFSFDSVLLCLANTQYKNDEYIRHYDEFVKETNNE